MVNQKPISVKMEYDILEALDLECQTGWMKRNRHINEAVRFYLEYKDAVRRIRSYGSSEAKEKELQDFEKKWFPMMSTR